MSQRTENKSSLLRISLKISMKNLRMDCNIFSWYGMCRNFFAKLPPNLSAEVEMRVSFQVLFALPIHMRNQRQRMSRMSAASHLMSLSYLQKNGDNFLSYGLKTFARYVLCVLCGWNLTIFRRTSPNLPLI